MLIDGKKLAEEIKTSLKEEVLASKKNLRLAVVKLGSDPVTEKFLEQKKKFGNAIGVDMRIYDFPESISTNELRKKVSEIVHIEENSGVIIQLPLPKEINVDYILDAIPSKKDPDMLSSKSLGALVSGRSKILSPVVSAIKYIFTAYGVELKAKRAVVVGAGRLVGKPAAIWLMNEGATVTVLNEYTLDPKPYTLDADIVISGAGKAKLITADMVKEGVVIIDCGTSESAGQTRLRGQVIGDVDPEVAEKASFFTPVPGGVGPLTVAMLFQNLVNLTKKG